MKLLLSVLLVLCFIFPFTISAQNWTAEEQEVLAQIKKGWSSWEKAVQEKLPEWKIKDSRFTVKWMESGDGQMPWFQPKR